MYHNLFRIMPQTKVDRKVIKRLDGRFRNLDSVEQQIFWGYYSSLQRLGEISLKTNCKASRLRSSLETIPVDQQYT
jgi:hypothetical protein